MGSIVNDTSWQPNKQMRPQLILKTKFEKNKITQTSFILYITIHEINVGISRSFKYSWSMWHKILEKEIECHVINERIVI
jgi:hypothetical protein